MTFTVGKYGRGICHITIHGSEYFKFQSARGGVRIQKHFKSYSEARHFAIAFYQTAGVPESFYGETLLNPDFYEPLEAEHG